MNIKAFSVAALAVIATAAFAPSASAQYYGGGYGYKNSTSGGYGRSVTGNPSYGPRHKVGSNAYYNQRARNTSSRSGCSSFSMSSYC